jgi:hypothetical protein
MKKFTLASIATSVLLVSLISWRTDATALTAPIKTSAVPKPAFAIQKVGCLLAGRYCRVGYQRANTESRPA